jgi:sulfite exporter TauE/SafE
MLTNTSGFFSVLFLSGFLGSLGHCLGMCGPLVLMLGVQVKHQQRAAWVVHALYHASRIVVYAILGTVIGGIGSLLGLGSRINFMAGITSTILGLGVILLGLGYLGWLPLRGLDTPDEWFGRLFGKLLKRGGISGILLLGALNGLLPCGLVYSALLLSASGGSLLRGMLGMLVFGIGTFPALIVVGLGAGALSARFRQTLTRFAGGLMMIAGLQLLLRGLAALGVMSHFQIGELIFW